MGFIAADGYIHKISKGKTRLVIELSEKDENVLIDFLKDIESNHPVQKRTSKTRFGGQSAFISLTRHTFVSHFISNRVKDSECFGLIDIRLKPHFIRGLFDGDGCLHLETYNPEVCGFNAKQYRWILASQHDSMLKQIQDYLIDECQLSRTKILFQKVWKLKYSGNKQVKRLMDCLYPEGKYPFMNRKSLSPV